MVWTGQKYFNNESNQITVFLPCAMFDILAHSTEILLLIILCVPLGWEAQ